MEQNTSAIDRAFAKLEAELEQQAQTTQVSDEE